MESGTSLTISTSTSHLTNNEREAEQAWNHLTELLDKMSEIEDVHWQHNDESKLQLVQEKLKDTERTLALSEHRALELQREIDSFRQRLAGSERKAEELSIQLDEMMQEMANVDTRAAATQTDETGEYRDTVALEGMVQRVESHLQAMTSSDDIYKDPVDGEQEISKVLTEFDNIKIEMERLLAKYDREHKRRARQKKLWRTKFFDFRETAKREKLKSDEQLDKVETELILTKSTLQKELEYRKEIENCNHKLLIEQRDLISRMADQEEVIRQRVCQLVELETRATRLQQHKGSLNETMWRLAAQQQDLDSKIDNLSQTKT